MSKKEKQISEEKMLLITEAVKLNIAPEVDLIDLTKEKLKILIENEKNKNNNPTPHSYWRG